MTVGIMAAPIHDYLNDGIWYESADSTKYRGVTRDENNRLTYCDNETTIPDGVIQDTGIAQNQKIAVLTNVGENTMMEAGAAIPSTATNWPWLMLTTNGRFIPFVKGANKYACAIAIETASGAGKIFLGRWLGPVRPYAT